MRANLSTGLSANRRHRVSGLRSRSPLMEEAAGRYGLPLVGSRAEARRHLRCRPCLLAWAGV